MPDNSPQMERRGGGIQKAFVVAAGLGSLGLLAFEKGVDDAGRPLLASALVIAGCASIETYHRLTDERPNAANPR